ncbi:putative ABC transport system substrate-binding protein [Alphaproteobacteria bacterium]
MFNWRSIVLLLTALLAAIGVISVKFTYNNDIRNNATKVGIIQIVEHPALDVTRKGIIDELKICCSIETVFESAHGNVGLAVQIAQKFAQSKLPLIVTIGTVATQSAMKHVGDIPIVFSSVTDPVSAGIVGGLKIIDNVTGVSNFVPVEPQLSFYKKVLPKLSALGFIYNPGEANSVKLLEETQAAAEHFGIKIIPAVADSSNEVATAARSVIGKVDAIFINNDNTALSALQIIIKIAEENKIPVFCSDIDTVDDGVVAAIGPDQYDIGIQTGKIAASIINKQKVIKELPVQFPKTLKTVLNLRSAKKIGLDIPQHLVDISNKVVK